MAIVGPDGKRTVQDGKHTKFRCFSASQEAQYQPTYQARFMNGALIKSAYKLGGIGGVADLLEASLLNAMPRKQVDDVLIRWHIGGGMFALWYFDAWLEVGRRRPTWNIYGYLKALPFWVKRMDVMPPNVNPVASYGGTHDHLIEEYGLRFARVVHSREEADLLGLEVDIDDSLAAYGKDSFALIIHSTQPKGSKSAAAVARIRREKRLHKKMKALGLEQDANGLWS